jgi:tRNA (cytidine/uridine-2'-O-)-methyltransferase
MNNHYERHIVLVAPDVHWNTGNVGRTCVGTGAYLHLIKPLGFSIESKEVKRAGLDYWHKVKLSVWDSFAVFKEGMRPEKKEIALFTKNGSVAHWNLTPAKRMFLVFGSETKGLSPEILSMYADSTYRIPIKQDIRSLNLSTAVGIALYESIKGDSFRF